MKLHGNTVFIAGGTSGIGLGLALRLHDAGNTVIIGGRRKHLLDRIAAQYPGIATIVVDTRDPASVRAAAAAVQAQFPATNVLVPMAGIMLPEELHTADFLPTAEATVETNLLGPLRLIAAFTEFLAERESATIMTVSSGLAFVPLPATPTYNATKAAIHSFSESLRVQLGDTSIEVLELIPPGVRTALMGQESAENAMPLDDYLDEVMQLLASQDTPEITVQRALFLRNAEANGTYAQTLAMLSGH